MDYGANKPFQSKEDFAVSESLALANIPYAEVLAVRPNLPPVPNPDLVHMPPITIADVLGRGLPLERTWTQNTGTARTPRSKMPLSQSL